MEKPSRHVSSYREALYLNAEDQVSVSFPIQFGLSHSGVVSGPWRCDALFDLQLLFREDFQVPKEIQMSISDESQEQEFRILTDPKKTFGHVTVMPCFSERWPLLLPLMVPTSKFWFTPSPDYLLAKAIFYEPAVRYRLLTAKHHFPLGKQAEIVYFPPFTVSVQAKAKEKEPENKSES